MRQFAWAGSALQLLCACEPTVGCFMHAAPSGTPGGRWRGSGGRPSPMSAQTTHGLAHPLDSDPFTFTVTDRRVRGALQHCLLPVHAL